MILNLKLSTQFRKVLTINIVILKCISLFDNIVSALDSINFQRKMQKGEICGNRTIAYYDVLWLLIIPLRIHSTLISDGVIKLKSFFFAFCKINKIII